MTMSFCFTAQALQTIAVVFFLQGHFNALGTPCIYLSLKGSVGECKEHNKREQLFSYFFQGSHGYLKYSFYMQPCGKCEYYCPVCHCGYLLYFWHKAVNILRLSKVFESAVFAKQFLRPQHLFSMSCGIVRQQPHLHHSGTGSWSIG